MATATSSYAAHASYTHVCAMASARATIGGPLRNDLLSRTSASVAAFQSATTVAQAEAAQTKTPAKVVTLIIKRNSMVFSNLDPDDGEGTPVLT